MFDDLQKQPHDNLPIGIILCADKEETVVKYSAIGDREQLFASQYQLYLPTEEELIALLHQDRLILELDDENG